MGKLGSTGGQKGNGEIILMAEEQQECPPGNLPWRTEASSQAGASQCELRVCLTSLCNATEKQMQLLVNAVGGDTHTEACFCGYH